MIKFVDESILKINLKKNKKNKETQHAIILYLATTKERCEVCMRKEAQNIYGAYTCRYCTRFFENSLQKVSIPHCVNRGKCNLNFRKKMCDFCRLNKCYNIKLNYEIILHRSFEISQCRVINKFLKERIGNFLECLLYMEQFYYKWLNTFPSFRKLSEKDKQRIRKRSHARGAILQLIERSLPVFKTIRLHNSFVNEMSFFNKKIRNILRSLLKFREYFTKVIDNMDDFYVMKLQLALKHDFILTDKALTVTNHQIESLDTIVNEIIEFMNKNVYFSENGKRLCFDKKENFETIESYNLFDYSSDIPDDKYPYNRLIISVIGNYIESFFL